ncbi:MAG: hypothetical protein CM1200mP9_11850 [Gammaproteobacteria bacterium]|nr:MAG: hypothetical protein CM1200mP9_11850 [Gammaproteobacteria bacterium]
MDGTAIMQGVATVFIAQYFPCRPRLYDYLKVILTATMAFGWDRGPYPGVV